MTEKPEGFTRRKFLQSTSTGLSLGVWAGTQSTATAAPAASTGRWNDWVCAPVNLEKAFLHTWLFCQRFDEVQTKYGRRLRIKTFHEEEWTIIESRSADVKVADMLKEFEFQTYEDFIRAADAMQQKHRN